MIFSGARIWEDTSQSASTLQKHASKARRNMFADKASRLKNTDLAWRMKYHYKNIRVQDDRCDVCKSIEDTVVIEDREHYLYCKAHQERRAKITIQIKKELNANLKKPVDDIPIYWNKDEKHANHANELWRSIEKFTPKHASQALIPVAWVTYLKSLPWNDKVDLEAVIARCQKLCVEGLLERTMQDIP